MRFPPGFLEDICEHPDDDAPRLVLADWLEDHGDEEGRARAEFIRVQIEKEREPAGSRRWWELGWREEAILRMHYRGWLAEAPAWALDEPVFRRGVLPAIARVPLAEIDDFDLPFFETVVEVRHRRA